MFVCSNTDLILSMFSNLQLGYPSNFSMRLSVEIEIPVLSAKSSTVHRRIARHALICSDVIKNIIPVYEYMIPMVSKVDYNGLYISAVDSLVLF